LTERTASTPAELLAALDGGSREIRVVGVLQGMPSIRLPAGAGLTGGRLIFGARGVVLSADNRLEDIDIDCPPHEVAVGNATTVENLGTLALSRVRTKGQVLLVADGSTRSGAVLIDDLHVAEADLRGREQRPHGYGVDVLQGALTIWNRHDDPDSNIEVEARGVSAGSAETPIRGSGLFIGGRCDDNGRPIGGTVHISVLETGAVLVDGGIPVGTPDLISGGVFVQAGAAAESVTNVGPTTTLGANDMALDNWGRVSRWTCTAPVTTRGPSGIGFVNFGDLDELDLQSPIETYGVGARGFNLYDGTLKNARFDSIATHGDGAVGIQVAKSLPALAVRRDVATAGGEGTSLVRGRQVQLQAIAVSIKDGGHIGTLSVGGDIKTTGDQVVSLEVLGIVDHFDVGGRVVAEGEGSDAAHITSHAAALLDGVDVVAPRGRSLVEVDSVP
jgi:hypothetical protein